MRRFRPAAPKPTAARSAVGVPTAAALLLLMALPTGLGAAIFSVTRADDLPDSAAGDDLCVAAAGGGCSLRAAVQGVSDRESVSSTLGGLSVVGVSPPGASLSLGCSIVGLSALTGGNLTDANNGLNVDFAGGGCVGPSHVDGNWSL